MLGEYDVCKNCNARFIGDIDNPCLCDDCLKETEEDCPIEDLDEDGIKEKIEW
jgi:hypothetical protein